VESFAGSDHGGKYGVAGVLTVYPPNCMSNLMNLRYLS
jgi:hypothetical protein